MKYEKQATLYFFKTLATCLSTFSLSFIFSLMWLNSANARECKNWISVSELQRSQNGEAAKAGCKKNEKCFCYDGVDLRDAKIGMKSVDDFEKPIYEYTDFEKYSYFDEEKEEEVTKEMCPDTFFLSETKNDCERFSGYEQKEVEALIIDEDKKSQRIQAEQLAKQKREEAQEKEENMRKAFEAWKEEVFIENGRVIDPEEARQRARNQRGAK